MANRLLLIMLLSSALAGCSLFTADPGTAQIPESQIATSVAGTEQALQAPEQQEVTPTPDDEVTQEPESSYLLPHALYYLSSADGENFQVWMLNREGNTTTRITDVDSRVDDFAVSQADGWLAYLTNNQLYVIDSNGGQAELLVDGKDAIDNTDHYFFTEKISGLSWSPDGKTLAYGRNGLHIYHFDTQTDEHILPNDIEARDEGFLFPRALYSPYQWSPDGSQLLVNINYYEAGTLGIYTPGDDEIMELGEGIVCCQPAWSPDNRSIVIASPYLGYADSGLWCIDTVTGKQTELIPATAPDSTLNFAGWPVVLPDGNLRYFYTNTPSFPTGDVPLLLVGSSEDGVTDRTILRPEQWLNYEVLWAEDGSLAIAVQPVTGEAPGWPRTGPIVLIPPSENPVIPLGINGFQLQWGP